MKRTRQTLPLGFCMKAIVMTAMMGYGIKLYRSWIDTAEIFNVRRIEVSGGDLVEEEEILRTGGLGIQDSITSCLSSTLLSQ